MPNQSSLSSPREFCEESSDSDPTLVTSSNPNLFAWPLPLGSSCAPSNPFPSPNWLKLAIISAKANEEWALNCPRPFSSPRPNPTSPCRDFQTRPTHGPPLSHSVGLDLALSGPSSSRPIQTLHPSLLVTQSSNPFQFDRSPKNGKGPLTETPICNSVSALPYPIHSNHLQNPGQDLSTSKTKLLSSLSVTSSEISSSKEELSFRFSRKRGRPSSRGRASGGGRLGGSHSGVRREGSIGGRGLALRLMPVRFATLRISMRYR